MIKFNSHEARLNFSKLMTKVANGNEVIIVRSGKDFAKITPLNNLSKKRIAGMDKDNAWVDEDFNDPLPAKLQIYFD
jgi:prevent-host-death family protein